MKKPIWLAMALLSAAASAAAPSHDGAATPAMSQSTPFISADEIATFMANGGRKEPGGHGSNELLTTGPYHAVMQYLTAPMKLYAQHEDADELFVVLEGSGTMIIGAKLVNPHQGAGATTLVADSGAGGTAHQLHKGDMFIVPVHQSRSVTQVDGKLVMMSMRLPRPDAATGGAASAQ